MRIGVVLHPYNEAKPGGLSRTILEWTRALLSIDRENEYIIFLKRKPQTLPDFPAGRSTFEFLGAGLFWLNRLKKAPRADVYIFQTPILPFFFKPKKSIIIAQDFPYLYVKPRDIHERFLNFVIRRYHALSLKRADKIIAVSESTKNEVMRFFNVPQKRISVIHMGFKNICAAGEQSVAVPEKFFLFVGVIKERKNVLRIVRAFNNFRGSYPQGGYKLVLAGRRSSSRYADIVDAYIKEHQLGADVIYIGHLNDQQLAYVYKRAEALIFPSIVEGFGFPVLEAMDCGTPVITSESQGPSEIGKGAAVLVDPYSPEEIGQAMERITKSKEFRDELVRKGLDRAKEFSWEKAARATLALIKTL